MLLDAGFSPADQSFVKKLTKDLFNRKCEDLEEKLNITVGRSAYAYMVPDFSGVLEPNEVYLDPSNFVDKISGISGMLLNNVDMLVARSPAHLPSDIQKVKAVFKVELMGLKDVVVFSTKAPSLAAKLSGGDFDGDLAWCCWEASLVDNFVQKDAPPPPDLFKDGHMRKDARTYKELVAGHVDPTSTFLQKSFLFNMQKSLLGICTNFKEEVCYTQGSVATTESTLLSALLSNLVDQAKQGCIFTQDDWNRFKGLIKIKPRRPLHRDKIREPKSSNITDQLMVEAHNIVEKSLSDLHRLFPNVKSLDADLRANCLSRKALAKKDDQWRKLLEDLDKDLIPMKEKRSNTAPKNRVDGTKAEFDFESLLVEIYDQFQGIRPHDDNALTQSLLAEYMADPTTSPWALVKASALCYYYKGSTTNGVWRLAGRQLARFKADAKRGSETVVMDMYVTLRPDTAYVKQFESEKLAVLVWENKGPPSIVDELEEMFDDDD